MLLRIGLASMVTGATFVAMAWMDPLGPLAILAGSGCCAVAIEQQLNIEDWQRAAQPAAVADTGDLRQDVAA